MAADKSKSKGDINYNMEESKKKEIEVIKSFNINGAVFEVIRMPETIYAGVIGFADEVGMKPKMDTVLERVKEKMYKEIDKIIIGKTSPAWEIIINTYQGTQKTGKKGIILAREVNMAEQPESVYVYIQPARTYIRCKCTPESAKLIRKESCTPQDLFGHINNKVAKPNNYYARPEWSEELYMSWREREYIEYDSADVSRSRNIVGMYAYVQIDDDKRQPKMGREWINNRRCGLLVDFPSDLTSEILKNDDVCSQYDPEEAYDALKLAHAFLTGITNELLENTETADEKVYNKLRLIWYLLERAGELKEEANSYCFYFKKENLYQLNGAGKKNNAGWIPKNYPQDFKLLSENGCYVEYYKTGNPTKSFKACDSGALFFDDRLTALGLKLFFNKVIQKRWYQKYDIGNRYSAYTGLRPKACKEVFDRIDMRIFNCGDRLEYDIVELLVGYSDELKKCFIKIYNFVKDNYPDCMPYIAIGAGCSANFAVDEKHRMIGQINFGGDEKFFDAFIWLSGKETEMVRDNIESFSEKYALRVLHETSCECYACTAQGLGQVSYRGKLYKMGWKSNENRFKIETEEDTDYAIQCMKIKAECDMNTR
ncbi:MAG: hypothetical protein FWD71_19125, partial [Oscillospiraceae bacterium]|nr:hypothetical protein [Oscillospiraceae bacterium]